MIDKDGRAMLIDFGIAARRTRHASVQWPCAA
jgi:hypothetical protein